MISCIIGQGLFEFQYFFPGRFNTPCLVLNGVIFNVILQINSINWNMVISIRRIVALGAVP